MDKLNDSVVYCVQKRRGFCIWRFLWFGFFFFLFSFLLFHVKANAAQFGNFSYQVQNGEATITDFDSDYVGVVTIPEAINGYYVTEISDYAFLDCMKITQVNFHVGIKKVGRSAFKGCVSLKEIKDYFLLEEIGSYAFQNCIALEGCFEFGSMLKSIGMFAFENCENLEEICFSEVNQGEETLTIGIGAFHGCSSLKMVFLPYHLKELQYETFLGCSRLNTVYIPPNVTSIADSAFGYNSYGSKNEKNPNLKILGLSGSAAQEYAKKNGFAFNAPNEYDGYQYFLVNNEAIIIYCKEKYGNLTIPSKIDGSPVAYIQNEAFFENTMTTLTIPSTVKRIGFRAFINCSQLKSVTISGKNLTIAHFAFSNCPNLESVILKSGVKKILSFSFASSNKLSRIDLGSDLTEIGEAAFWDDSKLTSIVIPASVSWIGQSAFGGCTQLKSFTFLGKNVQLAEYAIGLNADGSMIKGIVVNGATGSTIQSYCAKNGITFNGTHRFSDWKIIRAANCQSTGLKQRSCMDCVYTESVTINRTGHQYQTVSVKQATFSKNGSLSKRCSVCSSLATQKIYSVKPCKLSKTKYAYSGKSKKPSVSVKDSNGKALIPGTDYSVKYAKGRAECGTYKVIVTLTGNYKGSQTLKFKVLPSRVSGIQQRQKSGIFLQWDNVKGASGYEVWTLNKSTGKYQFLHDVKKPNIGNANATGSISFKIRAYRVVGDKTYFGSFSDVFLAKAI